MNEPTLRKRQQTMHIISIVVATTSFFTSGFAVAKFYFDHDKRLTVLEEFRQVGDRYTATDAARDFSLRDQRIDAIEKRTDERLEEIIMRFDRVEIKLDKLFTAR